MFDVNANASIDPNDFLNAAIIDNVVVENVPEPSSVALLGSQGLDLVCGGVGSRTSS
jgi:hypothetical protein